MNFQFEQIFSNIWAVAMVILFFGGSIFVHELGHFLAARRRGLHIERFSIGFGPKLFSWKRDGIDYRISLLPLGGYVALPQLADMSGIEGGNSEDAKDLPPISYTSKVIVSVMGAVFNIIFAFILATILWQVKVPSSESMQSTQIGYIKDSILEADGTTVISPAKRANLQLGDIILAVDGELVDSWAEVSTAIAISNGKSETGERETSLLIERNGEQIEVVTNPALSAVVNRRQIGIGSGYTVIVNGIHENSPAELAGMQIGDYMLEIDGQPLYSVSHFFELIQGRAEESIPVLLQRGDEILNTAVVPQEVVVTNDGQKETRIGISSFADNQVMIKKDPVTLMEEIVTLTIRTLSSLIDKNSDIQIKHMSGPAGIAKIIYDTSKIDFRLLLWVIVVININLAIFNLLPIPVLDGGHIMFATIAKLRNKPLPINFIASVQGTFMIALLGMILYVSFYDVNRIVTDVSAENEWKQQRITPVFSLPENISNEASKEADDAQP